MPQFPLAIRRRFSSGSMGLAPCAFSQRMSSRPDMDGVFGSIFGAGTSRTLVFRELRDVLFIIGPEIKDSVSQDDVQSQIREPFLPEELLLAPN
jgi:hypothetical protein